MTYFQRLKISRFVRFNLANFITIINKTGKLFQYYYIIVVVPAVPCGSNSSVVVVVVVVIVSGVGKLI